VPFAGTGTTSVVVFGTDNTTALNNVWQAAKASGVAGTIKLTGQYLCGPLNWSTANGINVEGVGPAGATASSGASTLVNGALLYPKGNVTGTWIDWGNNQYCSIKGLAMNFTYLPQSINIGLLILDGTSVETSRLTLENVNIRGRYAHSAVYAGGGLSMLTMRNCVFYNDFYTATGAPNVLAFTASNYASITSANYTVNSVATYSGCSDIMLENVEIHEQAQTGATRSTTFGIYMDGVDRGYLRGGHATTSNYHVKIVDSASCITTGNTTRDFVFENYVFESDPNPGTQPQALGALLLNSGSTAKNITFDTCYFKITGSGGNIIGSESGGGNTAAYDGLRVQNCRVSALATVANLFQMYGSSGSVRLANSYLECMGLAVIVNGSSDAKTTFTNFSTISAGSGGGTVAASPKYSTSGVTLPVIAAQAGTVGAPSYSFVSDSNTGIASPAADTMVLVTGGVRSVHIDASQRVGIGQDAEAGFALAVTGNVKIAGDVRWDGTTATAATSAGGLTLPAQNRGYLTVNIAGTSRRIPYYDA
jgi:hypothetical protein